MCQISISSFTNAKAFSFQNILCRNVSIVFHSAATVKFDEKLDLSVKINILGTKRLLQLCHRMLSLDVCHSFVFSKLFFTFYLKKKHCFHCCFRHLFMFPLPIAIAIDPKSRRSFTIRHTIHRILLIWFIGYQKICWKR